MLQFFMGKIWISNPTSFVLKYFEILLGKNKLIPLKFIES